MQEKPIEPKRRMQQVKFNSIDEFLAYLPDEELAITEYLRELVYECIPDCKEKLSFNVPYFSRHKAICFIWPSSVTWGKNKTYEGVRFGFTSGHLLSDEEQFLDRGNRKQVYWKDFQSLKDINAEQLRNFIYEAVLIDEETRKR